MIIFSSNLLSNPQITLGLGSSSCLVVNSRTVPPDLPEMKKTFMVDASGIARELGLTAGSFPIVNAAMVGAFAWAHGLIDVDTAARAVHEMAPMKKEENETAARQAFQQVQEVNCD